LIVIKLLKYLYIKIKSKLNKNTIIAINTVDKNILTFKNGSIIKCLPINDNTAIRGERSKFPICYDNFECCNNFEDAEDFKKNTMKS